MKASGHLVLLENREQVFWIQESNFFDPDLVLVAVTADALQALEELNYPCYPVSDITDVSLLVQEEERYIREIVNLSKEIENYFREHLPEIALDGPGFLSGNYYILQYSICGIAKRAFILLEIIKRFSPTQITAFRTDLDMWFQKCGYARNPWDDFLENLQKEYHYSLQFISTPPGQEDTLQETAQGSLIDTVWLHINDMRKRIFGQVTIFQKKPQYLKQLDGIRLLFANDNATKYDWNPILSVLRQNKNISLLALESYNIYHEDWRSATFSPVVKRLFSPEKRSISITPLPRIPAYPELLEKAFNSWLSEREKYPEIIVLGTDIFPYLIPHMKTLIIENLEVILRTDEVISEVISDIKPDAVCFYNITKLAERRLAYACEQKGIPTLCYQHGFGYNFQIQPKDEGCEQASATCVLSYGNGNQPREGAIFPVKAKFAPVGSARIEEMQKRTVSVQKKKTEAITILWIAEYTTQNTLVATLREDTKRYAIQKKCLEFLSNAKKFEVVYRPHAHQVNRDGTSSWILQKKSSSIRIDVSSPLEELINESDIVILDITSPTTWGEVLGLRKPFILFCDPIETPIKESCMSDLENSCCWCRSEKEFTREIHHLCSEPETVISQLQKIDTGPFLRKYILHEGDCIKSVCSLLISLYQKRKNL